MASDNGRSGIIHRIATKQHKLDRIDFKELHFKDAFGMNVFSEAVQRERLPKPVFKAILENSTRICDAKFGNMFLYQGNKFQLVAQHNAPSAYEEHVGIGRWSWRASSLSMNNSLINLPKHFLPTLISV